MPARHGAVTNAWSALSIGSRVGLVLGPLGFLAVGLAMRALGHPGAVGFTAGTVFWMACWWIAEPVPLWATALLPLVTFPLIGASPLGRVLLQYFDPVNFLFLGGMWIAAAMEEWNLHRRLALGIVAGVGVSPRRIVLGFMLGTAMISLWISNTAAALMMVPIGVAVLARFAELQGADDPGHRRFGRALMLGIAYAASMGGIGSKIGTGTNLVFVKEARRTLGLEVSFLSWFKVGLPVVLLAVPLSWWYLVRIGSPIAGGGSEAGRDSIRAERARQGRMSRGEWVVLLAFLLAAFLWVFRQPMDFGLFVIPGWSEHLPFGWPELLGRPVATLPPPLAELLGPRGPESVVALLVGGSLFFIPIVARPLRMALPVRRGMGIAWGLLVLLGGGFAMAEGISGSGLSQVIAGSLRGLSFPSPLVGFVIVCLITIALSEVASNTATASILLPLLAASAPSLGMQPAPLMFAATLAASFGFMLPAGTPPNAVAFASGYIKVTEMARSGLVVDLFGAVLIALVCRWLAPWALGTP
jgi:sodium-dependent dicarboxylate transporter 2/3/5